LDGEIVDPLPGMETLRGVLPIGLRDSPQDRLAAGGGSGGSTPVAVIDPGQKRVLVHLRRLVPRRVAIVWREPGWFANGGFGGSMDRMRPAAIASRVGIYVLRCRRP